MVELGLLEESAQLGHVLFPLAREAHDEGGAQRDAGDGGANALDQAPDHRAVPLPSHRAQHASGDVLERHVEVVANGRLGRHHLE